MEISKRNSRKNSLLKTRNDSKGIFTILLYKFKNLSLVTQLIVFFILLLFVFFFVIVFIKRHQFSQIFQTQNEEYYYFEFIQDFLVKQDDLLSKLTELNTKEDSQSEIRDTILLSIYSKELISHDFALIYGGKQSKNSILNTWKESSLSDANVALINNKVKTGFSNGYSHLNFTFHNFSMLSSFIYSANQDTSKTYLDPNHLIPIYWSFFPLLLQDTHTSKKVIVNKDIASSYFISYMYNPLKGECTDKTFNTYFKYPTDEETTTSLNTSPYDLIVDPVSKCQIKEFIGDKRRADKILKENFFMNFERNLLSKKDNSLTDLIVINKLLDLENRNDYAISSSGFTIQIKPDVVYVFSFIYRYLKLKAKSKDNYLSIIEYESNKNKSFMVNQGKNVETNYYFVGYNIDDSGKFIYNIPQFLENLFLYSNDLKNSEEFDGKVIDKIIGFKSNYLDLFLNQTFNKNLYSNYYLQYDNNFFTFLSFIKNYYKQRKLFNRTFCSNLNKTKYYEDLKSRSTLRNNNFNCLNEVCKIIDCEKGNSALKQPNLDKFNKLRIGLGNSEIKRNPECYCYPLLCFESETDEVPNEFIPVRDYLFKESNSSISSSPSNSTTSNNTQTQQAPIRNSFLLPDKCDVNFNYLSRTIKPYHFSIKMLFREFYFSEKSNLFTIFFNKEFEMDKLIEVQKNATDKYILILSLLYSFLLLGVGALMVKIFSEKIHLIINERIESFEVIHKKIISNEEMELNDQNGDNLLSSDCNKKLPGGEGEDEVENLKDKVNQNENKIPGLEGNNKRGNKAALKGRRKSKILKINVKKEELNVFGNENHDNTEAPDEEGESKKKYSVKSAKDNENDEKGGENLDADDNVKDRESIQIPDKSTKNKQKELFNDELSDLIKIFFNNIESFKINLEIGENFYKKNEVIINFLKDKKMNLYNNVLFQTKKESEYGNISNSGSIESSLEDEENYSTYSQSDDCDDINLLLLYEMLSTEVIDFLNYRHNFYFKEEEEPNSNFNYKSNSLFNFYNSIDRILYDDENNISDITNREKISCWINYFIEEVHKKWINKIIK